MVSPESLLPCCTARLECDVHGRDRAIALPWESYASAVTLPCVTRAQSRGERRRRGAERS